MVIYMYIATGRGQMKACGPFFFFKIINVKSICRFFHVFHYKSMTDYDAPGA